MWAQVRRRIRDNSVYQPVEDRALTPRPAPRGDRDRSSGWAAPTSVTNSGSATIIRIACTPHRSVAANGRAVRSRAIPAHRDQLLDFREVIALIYKNAGRGAVLSLYNTCWLRHLISHRPTHRDPGVTWPHPVHVERLWTTSTDLANGGDDRFYFTGGPRRRLAATSRASSCQTMTLWATRRPKSWSSRCALIDRETRKRPASSRGQLQASSLRSQASAGESNGIGSEAI